MKALLIPASNNHNTRVKCKKDRSASLFTSTKNPFTPNMCVIGKILYTKDHLVFENSQ